VAFKRGVDVMISRSRYTSRTASNSSASYKPSYIVNTMGANLSYLRANYLETFCSQTMQWSEQYESIRHSLFLVSKGAHGSLGDC
jgi:hypothetical protein